MLPTSPFRRAVAPVALSVACGAFCNVARADPTLEIDAIDFTKPVAGCVVTNEKGTALQKTEIIRKAHGQTVLGGGLSVELDLSGKHALALKNAIDISTGTQIGYYTYFNKPLDNKPEATQACFIPLKNVATHDPKNKNIPENINSGGWSENLQKFQDSGIKVLVTAETLSGKWFLLHHNGKTGLTSNNNISSKKHRIETYIGVGAIVISEQGNNPSRFTLVPEFKFTKAGQKMAESNSEK